MAGASDGVGAPPIRCSIVIIGAGMAGLAAASHLVKSGFFDFKILEARGRIGGRIFALDTGQHQLELGANWIHGVLGNPLFELAMANGLVDITQVPRPHHVIAATRDGQQVPFALLQETYEAYTCFVRRCEEYFVCNFEPPDGVTSVGQHVRLETNLFLAGAGAGAGQERVRRMIFECLLKRETCITGCHSMDDVDLMQMGSFTEMQGGNISLPQGFGSLVSAVSRDIPADALLLRRSVTTVRWGAAHSRPAGQSEASEDSDDSDDSGASDCTVTEVHVGRTRDDVTLPDATVPAEPAEPSEASAAPEAAAAAAAAAAALEVCCADGTRVLATHAIVTLPLGVLQREGGPSFEPPLPLRKTAAIQRMLFATVDKILLEFSRPVFPANVSELLLLWDPADEPQGQDLSETWYRKIYSFSKLSDTLLLGWISGREADYMETLPMREVGQRCVGLLRTFLADPALPEPCNCVCSSWGSQEFTRGAYTAMAVGASQRDIDLIAEPLTAEAAPGMRGRLMFAGEHTHRSFYSTAHGAFLSGRTAAAQLLTAIAAATEAADADANADEAEIALSCDHLDLSSWIQGIAL